MKPRKTVVPGRRRSEPYERPRRRPALASPPGRPISARSASTPAGPATVAPGPALVARPIDLLPARSGALVLQGPVLLASGAAGYGIELGPAGPIAGTGALVTPSTTLEPRPGRRGPRMAETPEGIVVADGLPNPGIDVVIERYLPLWRRWALPVIVSLAADSPAGFAALAGRLEGLAGVAGLELNLGAGDADRGGQPFDLDPAAARAVVGRVRAASDLPLVVKLSAAAPRLREIARAVEASGADAIAITNPLPALALIQGRTGGPDGRLAGGLSGPAIRPIALRAVDALARTVRLPIVGVGGIVSGADARAFVAAGAAAVGIATAALADPTLAARLGADLDEGA